MPRRIPAPLVVAVSAALTAFSVTAFAESVVDPGAGQKRVSAFCSSSLGVQEIKAYVACQADPKLGACAGLESQQAGRLRMAPMLLASVNAIEARKKDFVEALAQDLNIEWAAREAAQSESAARARFLPQLRAETEKLKGEIRHFEKEHEIGAKKTLNEIPAQEKSEIYSRLSAIQGELHEIEGRVRDSSGANPAFLERRQKALEAESSELLIRLRQEVRVDLDPTSAEIKRLEELLAKVADESPQTTAEKMARQERVADIERRIVVEREKIKAHYQAFRARDEALQRRISSIQGHRDPVPIQGTSTAVDREWARFPKAANVSVPNEVIADHRKQAEAVFQELKTRALAGERLTPELAEAALKKNATSLFANFDELSLIERLQGATSRMERMKDATLRFADDLLGLSVEVAIKEPGPLAGTAARGISAEAAERQAAILASRSTIASTVSKALSSGARPLAALGGPYGMAALAAAEIIFTPSDAACADQSGRVNADSTNACRPRYEVNRDVVRFLDLPQEEQESALRSNPSVCDFYEKLHAKLFKKPDIHQLACKGRRGFVLRARNERNEIIEHNVSLNEQQNIRRVELARDGAPHGDLRFNPDGTLFSSLVGPGNLEKTMSLKMYILGPRDCCLSDGEAHAKCMERYNAPSSARKPSRLHVTEPVQ